MINLLSHFAAAVSNVTPVDVSHINNIVANNDSLPRLDAGTKQVSAILAIVFGILGAIALVIIVKSGFEYITSSGDPQKAANARNSIIYALIGVIVGISAFAIVTFVINRID